MTGVRERFLGDEAAAGEGIVHALAHHAPVYGAADGDA